MSVPSVVAISQGEKEIEETKMTVAIPNPLRRYAVNFDDNKFRGWNPKYGITSWRWSLAAKTANKKYGPDSSVSGTGLFAYINGDGFDEWSTGFAQLESQPIVYPVSAGPRPAHFVLSFWFMMQRAKNDNEAKLEVLVRKERDFFRLNSVVWSAAGDKGKVWNKVELMIPFLDNEPIRVAFKGHMRVLKHGYIAIDDVRLFPASPEVESVDTEQKAEIAA